MTENSRVIIRTCRDLGMSAYLMMQGFKVHKRRGKTGFDFKVNTVDVDEFEKAMVEYVNSPYHTFDSYIMSLKRL